VDDSAVYMLDVDTLAWIQLTPNLSARSGEKTSEEAIETPCLRLGHTLSYVPTPSGAKMVLFGGSKADGEALNDTWIFDICKFHRPALYCC
jgi:hypothetical protein